MEQVTQPFNAIVRTEPLKVAYVRITREAPWSLDPSVSSAGHETVQGPSAGFSTYEDVLNWIAAHAPEVDMSQTPYLLHDDVNWQRLSYTGRDTRDYFTTVYVSRWFMH